MSGDVLREDVCNPAGMTVMVVASLLPGTKIAPPIVPRPLVPRPRLSSQLDNAMASPLTLVAAGPGFGKTVLLSSWIANQRLPAAWITLDASDNSPVRLWRLIGDALLAAGVVSESDSFAALPHEAGDTSAFMSAMLAAVPDPSGCVVVLDDAHHLDDPALMAELDAVIRYGSTRLRLILSTRSDPMLPLHRYRLAGQIREIRARELAMTRQEAHALLQSHGVVLSASHLDLLANRTEGWPAGLRLSAMSMAGAASPEDFVTQLAIDQGSVGEYLLEEVLDRLQEPVRRLLIQTSFLEEVSGPLASAVTGIIDADSVLRTLARANSFVVPLDHSAGRYRYHQLLREVLQYLLQREHPDQLRELRGRAARWFEQAGHPIPALRYSVESQDWAHTAHVLVRGGFASAYIARQDVAALGLDGVSAMPIVEGASSESTAEVHVAQAAAALTAGRDASARKRLEQARALPHRTADTEATALLVEFIAANRLARVNEVDRAAAALLDTGSTASAIQAMPGLTAVVRIGQAGARYWSGTEQAGSHALLLEAIADAQRVERPDLELECLGLLQLMDVQAGRLERAKATDARALALVRRAPDLHRSAIHHLARACAAFLQADFPLASRLLRQAEQTVPFDPDRATHAAVATLRARLLLGESRAADAHQLLRASDALSGPLPPALASGRLAALAEVERGLGRPRAALKLLGEAGAAVREDPLLALAGARALIDIGDLGAARRALRPALVSADGAMPRTVLVAALLTSARLAELGGDDGKAIGEVVRAAAIAEGVFQPFSAMGAELAGLMARHPQAMEVWPSVAAIALPDGAATRPAASGPPPEALTDKETAVLRRLATTMTTAEIADELSVTVNTVKSHIAAIYRKLPASGRRDAVTRARQFELL